MDKNNTHNVDHPPENIQRFREEEGEDISNAFGLSVSRGKKEKERAWPKFMVFLGPCEVYILYIKLLRGAEASVVL
jgi:hypothetical protein